MASSIAGQPKPKIIGGALLRSLAYRKYHRRWMRRWRKNKENRIHEQTLWNLRLGLKEGIISAETYLEEVWHPGKVKVLARKDLSR